jgi:hypothetical protein
VRRVILDELAMAISVLVGDVMLIIVGIVMWKVQNSGGDDHL